MEGDAAQVVQLGIDAVGDHPALLDLVVLRIGIDLAGQPVAHGRQGIDPGGDGVQRCAVGGIECRPQHFERRQRVLQLHELAGRNTLCGNA